MNAIHDNYTAGAKARDQQPAGFETSSSGMVLIVVIIFAAVASILAAGLHSAGSSRIKQVQQEMRFEKSFFVAEDGIELAKNELRYRAFDLNEVLRGNDGAASTADDGVLSFGSPTNYGEGQFYVKVRNNSAEPNPYTDTDRVVVIRATGIVDTVKRVIEVEVRVAPFVPAQADGALGIYGTNTELTVTGNGKIDGNDWDVPDDFGCSGAGCNGTLTTNPASVGVLYPSTTTVINADADKIDGNPPTTNAPGTHDEAYWYEFLNEMEAVATLYTGGSLGTRDAPMVSILPLGPTTINGNTAGAGILIVPGTSNLRITGTFHFEGLVILEGDGVIDADSEVAELGTCRIFGAVVAVGGELDITATGTADIKYSTEALANLRRLQIPAELTVLAWKEIKASSADW